MPAPALVGMLTELRNKCLKERRESINRAVSLQDTDPRMAAYYTGVADGRNGIAEELRYMLNSASIPKEYRENEQRHRL